MAAARPVGVPYLGLSPVYPALAMCIFHCDGIWLADGICLAFPPAVLALRHVLWRTPVLVTYRHFCCLVKSFWFVRQHNSERVRADEGDVCLIERCRDRSISAGSMRRHQRGDR